MANSTPKDTIPKIVFFDLDNTLYRQNHITEDNVNVLHELHAKGIKVAIATGRGIGMMPSEISDLIEQGIISAYVFMNGQYNRTNDNVITTYPLTYRECETIINVCNEHNLDYKFDSATHCGWTKNTPNFDKLFAKLIEIFPNLVVDAEFHKQHKVYQCSILVNDDTYFHQIQQALIASDLVICPWTSKGADIFPKWSSKVVGVKDVCNHFRIRLEDTMAFGDGLNDMKMLEETALSVAMGDSKEQVKGVADYVTGTIEENGIRSALCHFGIL